MTKLLELLGLAPTHAEREILKKLNNRSSSSMRVVGRGMLVMSAKDARSTVKAKKFIQDIDSIVK